MTHLTTELIERADEAAIAHLEVCELCRDLIVTDVELAATKSRVIDAAVAAVADSHSGPAGGQSRPLVVFALAAGFVLAVFAPLLLLDPFQAPDLAGDEAVTVPVRTESDPPPPPVPSNDLGSYEMTFTVGERSGRLIWDSPTFYEGLVTVQETASGPTHDYGFYRAGTDWGFEDSEDDEVVVELGAEQPDIRRLPDDPQIPWDALINSMSVEEIWSWMGGEPAEMSLAAPIHPMATEAWFGGSLRLEVSERGIPVLIERPEDARFDVTQLTYREIRPGEVGNNTDFPFAYALHLAGGTSEMQRSALEDGLVTFADYEAAAAEAAECAGVELEFSDSLGMFVFPEDPRISDCVAMHVDDIAEVWRVGSQFIDLDEFTALWYTIEGRPESAAMHLVEPGPERRLANGDGWAVSIAQRGEGYCIYTRAESSYTEGCLLPGDLPVPHVLDADVTTSYEGEEQLLGASVVGIVTARADRVVIVWSSGEETSLTPGEVVEFGFRGFGMISHGDQRGEPIAVHAFAGDELLGTQMP